MKPTRKQLALQYLRKKLERGELPPGARLSDFALAKEMGISRTPVREAIQTLVAEGVAQAAAHSGVFVKRLTKDDVRELYELREALEGFAAARVAATREACETALETMRATCQTLRTLEREARQGKQTTLSEAKTLAQREADLAFHRLLIDAAGNARLARAVEDSAMHTRLFATMPRAMPVKVLREARTNHERILQAIASGDADAARAAMAAHIRQGLAGRLAAWEDTPAAAHGDLPPALQALLDDESSA